jgi:NAD(P)-dependent dehydrogenase (short-subunit alcohol dehydrogenase family)
MSSQAVPRLQNKVVIVTGGSSGFGAAIALLFAQHGAKVIVADLNAEGGQKLALSNPASLHFVQCNVAVREDWERLLKETVDKWQRVDVVINNAGTSYRNKVTALDASQQEMH